MCLNLNGFIGTLLRVCEWVRVWAACNFHKFRRMKYKKLSSNHMSVCEWVSEWVNVCSIWMAVFHVCVFAFLLLFLRVNVLLFKFYSVLRINVVLSVKRNESYVANAFALLRELIESICLCLSIYSFCCYLCSISYLWMAIIVCVCGYWVESLYPIWVRI